MTKLESKIEALLFWKAEPVSKEELGSVFKATAGEIETALSALDRSLSDRGVRLIFKEQEVMLSTAPEAAAIIEALTKERLTKDLGRAGLEALAIILYRGPVSRREIDYIRGVNSSFIIRHLLVRGLVEKTTSETDERVFLYKPTFELIAFLGLTKVEDLPEYHLVRQEIDHFGKETEAAVQNEAAGGEVAGLTGDSEKI
jgi:segregation and condensation protein B